MNHQILKFRVYDKTEMLENDPWTVCKIIKLLIKEKSCFKIFERILHDEIPFIPGMNHMLPLTVHHLIHKHWLNRDIIYTQKPFRPISTLHMVIIAHLLSGCLKRVKIESVFTVALESNVRREA